MNKLLNMKSLKTLSLILGTCVSFYACTDLDEELVGEFTESYSEANPAAAFINAGSGGGGADALGAAFSKLRDGSAGHFGHFSAQTLPSDEAWIATKGGDWYDGGILIDLHKHNFLANNGIIGNTWNQQYGGIAAVNDAIGSVTADEARQLRVVRAFFYYRLLDLYGTAKYVTEAGDEGQLSRADLFAKVEGELLDVVGLTRADITSGNISPETFGSTTNSYRVNHFAVLGLLSKLYLNAEVYTRASFGGTGTAMWTEARNAASYVIDNSPYRLATSGATQAGVGAAGTPMVNVNLGRLNSNEVNVGGNQQYPDGTSSADNIYAQDNMEGYTALFAANNDQGNPEFIWSIEYDEVTAGGMNFAKMTLHYGSQQTFNFEAQPWNGYATLSEFYENYEAGDVRKHTNHLAGVQRTFNGGIVRDFAKEPNDASPDLEFTGSNDGGIFPNGLRQAGARLGKFSFKQFGRPDQDNDYPIIRLGDLYLVRAEANARLAGDWNAAAVRADVGLIRARAGLSSTPAITEAFFLAERGREMFQESTRRQDQIRFGQYVAGSDSGRGTVPTTDHRIVMPIPLDAINASNGSLTQTSGY